jgi:hypothetical protein
MLQKRDGRTRVYRCRNERFAGSVMIWGAISYAINPQLVHIPGNRNAARYRDEVLTPHMLPAMNLCREGFQNDKAEPHTARSTIDFLANQNVRVLPWPSKSPDMNTIEHLLDDLDRRLRRRQPAPQALHNYRRFLSKNGENSARPYMSRRMGTVTG